MSDAQFTGTSSVSVSGAQVSATDATITTAPPFPLEFASADIQRFLFYQREAFQECQRRIDAQEAVRDDYNTLRTRLTSIADQTRYPTVVPVGPHVLMRGELVHTNEILVFLGDNYFVERSSKQAGEIAVRRIFTLESQLKKLYEERSLLQNKMDMLANLAQQPSVEDVVEIREKLDEPQGPGEERSVREKLSTDEEIRIRLDELEAEEGKLSDPEADVDDDMIEEPEEDGKHLCPVPPPYARPRRSSLPSGGKFERDSKERKSVTFAPIPGKVPERENKDFPIFKQALRMMLASGKYKSMDAGSLDADDWLTQPPMKSSVEGAPPKLKKQGNVTGSIDSDLDGTSDVLPVVDTDEIMERNVGASSAVNPSRESPSSAAKPVSRFKASRIPKDN